MGTPCWSPLSWIWRLPYLKCKSNFCPLPTGQIENNKGIHTENVALFRHSIKWPGIVNHCKLFSFFYHFLQHENLAHISLIINKMDFFYDVSNADELKRTEIVGDIFPFLYSIAYFCPSHLFSRVNATRGGSRIPRRRGRQPSGGAPTYDFAKFCEKLHEIEKILGRRAPPPLNPPLATNEAFRCHEYS